jgi:CBS domain-containing protein
MTAKSARAAKSAKPAKSARRTSAAKARTAKAKAARAAKTTKRTRPASKAKPRRAPKPVKTARDLMTLDVLFVHDDMTLEELAAFLTDHEISGAAVRDRDGNPVGVVSLTDLAGVARGGGAAVAQVAGGNFYDQSWEDVLDEWDAVTITLPQGETRVADIMTPTILTVEADAPVHEIARTMLDSHVHRLLVRERGELVGIVTTSDLLSVFASSK